jgi:CDP-paratose 2-epimerase
MNRKVLITGGAGFIGSNLAKALLREGASVRIVDNLSRRGVEHNLGMLRSLGGRLEFIQGDVRNRHIADHVAGDVDEIYHLAAQVAVTTSIEDPRTDVETNLIGTFNVLEAARRSGHKPFLLFTSTNKVYGDLEHLPLRQSERRYQFADREAVDERERLDFHSPYGCSKGAAEQYVRDYARIYDLPTVVFRMSCIAGPQQFGNEDQGWLAHFLYSALEDRAITIYGDGRQVRDILNVADLIRAISLARQHQSRTVGNIYNVGGGPPNATSLLEVLEMIERATGRRVRTTFEVARQGDQRIFIADTTRFFEASGWSPQRSLSQTIEDILDWRSKNAALFIPAAASAETAHSVA